MKAKIRGIYTTTLTKVLLENGFEIVYPSLTIKKRFELSDNSTPPDLKIKDRSDLQGIRVFGTSDGVNTFHSILQSTFEDVLTLKWTVNVGGIYKGKATESDEYAVYVDISNGTIGRLPESESRNVDNNQLIVQVERKRIGTKQPVLNTKLKILGTHAILIQNSKVGVSLKIRDINKRAELYELGKTLTPDGWGIIWREPSATQSKHTLENDITKLIEKTKLLNDKAKHVEAPALLIEGSYFVDVEFPCLSKQVLDKLRASMAPTLDGHHFYKSCGGDVSATLEMAERLLEEGQDIAKVEKTFKENILYKFPEENSSVDVEHVKLNGAVFHLGQATVERLDNKQIKYRLIMRTDGSYDGLDVKKDTEDRAESETKMGEWYIAAKYFSKDGEWKGTYINVNMPMEVYPNAIRYVDLEVNVGIRPDGSMKILDTEKLESALEKGIISKKLLEIIKEKVKEITQANTIESATKNG